MPPVIYLLRHGLTDANRNGVIAGTFESKLLPEGMEQSRQAGVFLKKISKIKKIGRIFCSPMIRTRETLKALKLGKIPTQFDDRLREFNCGIYEGRPDSAIPERLSRANVFAHPNRVRTGGECVNDIRRRVRSFIGEKLSPLSSSAPVLIISHGGAGSVILWELLPRLTAEIIKVEIRNAEVWKIEGGKYERVFEPDK
jgi:probable phosphoglycerate mutase